jgi:hypothetical protein
MSSENKSLLTMKGFLHKLILAHPSIQGVEILRKTEELPAIPLAWSSHHRRLGAGTL